MIEAYFFIGGILIVIGLMACALWACGDPLKYFDDDETTN